ncbi:hypothetical protein [Mycobacteroides abscessus]|uniref:hypothetical protein n=1 Tax=Mycobacteroides abscessus TaxID=36809 RepID=UPI0005E6BA2C|nr:hypothetical protein [Mycobacteroides abscessus]CPS32900.1 Uncharacterised protein [Mycobacteroides abscessus]CPV14076.1 Uncharacterised protein [Mycobacteroides abscessus]
MTLRRSARWILREFIETLKIGWAGLALVLVNESFLLLFRLFMIEGVERSAAVGL